MELEIIIGILISHWIADFIYQSDEMAKNKSKSNYWLSYHVLIYTLSIGVFNLVMNWDTPIYIILWALVNGLLHFGVDFFTSRVTARLYREGEIHNFFVVVGLDQLIHTICLLATFKYLVPQ